MVFFDKIERDLQDVVYAIKKINKVDRELEDEIVLLRELPQTSGLGLYRTTIKHIDVNEAFFKDDGTYITYRVK